MSMPQCESHTDTQKPQPHPYPPSWLPQKKKERKKLPIKPPHPWKGRLDDEVDDSIFFPKPLSTPVLIISQKTSNHRHILHIPLLFLISLPCLSFCGHTFFWQTLHSIRGLQCKSNPKTGVLVHAATLHQADKQQNNWNVANKVLFFFECFFLFKSLTLLMSTNSDSALALVHRKVKTWPKRRATALHFRYSKRTVCDFVKRWGETKWGATDFWQLRMYSVKSLIHLNIFCTSLSFPLTSTLHSKMKCLLSAESYLPLWETCYYFFWKLKVITMSASSSETPLYAYHRTWGHD